MTGEGHPAMPGKANDGERWVIDSGSGFHLVGDKALTGKKNHLVERTGRPHMLETAGGMTTTET